jgi:putative glycerol-1-phosphate prenyltransferase
MEMQLYTNIILAKSENRKLLAILLDPDKIDWENLPELIVAICDSPATHVFVGGSLVLSTKICELIGVLKAACELPVLLFPGNPSQISDKADGILFLSLLSGRNPDYLIEYHVQAAPILKKSKLEIIATGYILIESGTQTAVETVSKTLPLSRNNNDLAVATALAGEMQGKKLIYLEAGSGAQNAVPLEMIQKVSEEISIPLIVGGGIRTHTGIQHAYNAGADLVVIGTAFENDSNFFRQRS